MRFRGRFQHPVVSLSPKCPMLQLRQMMISNTVAIDQIFIEVDRSIAKIYLCGGKTDLRPHPGSPRLPFLLQGHSGVSDRSQRSYRRHSLISPTNHLRQQGSHHASDVSVKIFILKVTEPAAYRIRSAEATSTKAVSATSMPDSWRML